MKNQKLILIMTILAVGALWFLFHKSPGATSHQQESATNVPMATTSAVQASAGTSTVAARPNIVTDSNPNDTNTTALATKYEQGLLGKDQAMRLVILEENKKSQDFYGKVIDQYGEPIVNVSVKGNLILNDGTYGGFNVEKYAATTDSNGFFEFTGIHGASLNVLINKDGYKMGERGEGYKGPVGSQASPTDRAILTMWKIHGAEPLTSSGVDAKIIPNGSSTTFDIATGKESSDGNFRVTLSRFPLEVKRGRDRFDWTAKIEVLDGGIMAENDPYPYLAPENGYKSFFEFNVNSNDVSWHPYLNNNFYIKTQQGQYGLMKLHINGSVTPIRLQANFTINPSGSQNLEPDFSK